MSRQTVAVLLVATLAIVALAVLGFQTRINDEQGETDLSRLLDSLPTEYPGYSNDLATSSALLGGLLYNPAPPSSPPRATATLTPLESQEADLKARGQNATYRVAYEITFTMNGGTIHPSRTIYQLGPTHWREDETSDSGDLDQTLRINGQEYACGWIEPECLTVENMSRVLDARLEELTGMPPFSDLLGNRANADPGDLARLPDITRLDRTPGPSPTARPTPHAASSNRTIVGESATCFLTQEPDSRWETCYSQDGVLLHRSYAYGSFTLKETAIAFTREVTEADFTLPYPIVEPTFAPTPASPPSASTRTP